MTELIATLALFTSAMLFVVHYRNQLERRQGEIFKLRSDFLQRLSGTYSRVTSIQMHMETARMELRHMPECDEKYNSIERIPRTLDELNAIANSIEEFRIGLINLDDAKTTRAHTLKVFQSVEHEFLHLEDICGKTENETLELLKYIRSRLEAADKQNT